MSYNGKETVVDKVESDPGLPTDNLKALETVDTVHGDEAAKVFANYTGEQEWTEAEEKKLQRKIDWRLLPVLCITYGLQYYDKAMLSQAVSPALPGSRIWDQQTDRGRCIGFIWTSNGPWSDKGQPLFNVRCYLLSGLHRWCLPCHDVGSALSHRACGIRYRDGLGRVPYLYRCLRQLPRTLCSEILPWPPREWYQSYVYGDCGKSFFAVLPINSC